MLTPLSRQPLGDRGDARSDTAVHERRRRAALRVHPPIRPGTLHPPPLLTAVDKTAIDRFRDAYRAGALEGQGIVTEGGRTLQRYTTTSGRRVDYLIDPRTNEVVADAGSPLWPLARDPVQLIERLPLNRRSEGLLTMPEYTDARVIRFGR